MAKPIAILVGDLHARETVPECRVDDFLEAQFNKWRWLKKLWEETKVPIVYAGDVFDKWKSSPWLLSKVQELLPPGLFIVGQHDISGHSMKNLEKSNLNVLLTSKLGWTEITDMGYLDNKDFTAWGYSWGTGLKKMLSGNSLPCLAVVHKFVYEKEIPWPGCDGLSAEEALEQLSGYELVLCGDNHQKFIYEKGNQKLLNPGSFLRMSADQQNFAPAVFIWKDDNSLEEVPVPIEKGVVSREHIERKKETDEKMNAWVESLNSDIEITLSFEENIKRYKEENPNVPDHVWDIVMTHVKA